MSFWKKHRALRAILMTAFFAAGLILVLSGWGLTGQLAGLGWMMIGIFCLLLSLLFYNLGF